MFDRDNNASNSVLQHVLQKQNKLAERLERMERLERPGNDVRAMAWSIGMLQLFPGLVGLWPGNVLGSGVTGNLYYADLSGHGLDLTRNAGTFIIADTAQSGLFSYYWFNGTSGYANHTDANILDIVGTESGIWSDQRGLTIGGWFKFDVATPAAEENLMGKYNPSGNQRSYLLKRTTAGRIQMQASTDGATQFNSGSNAVMATDTWYFVVGKYVPSTSIATYINGQLDSQQTSSIPASLFNSTAQFSMGANSNGPSNYFDGQASLCFLCAAAVPDAMIQSFYQYSRALFGA